MTESTPVILTPEAESQAIEAARRDRRAFGLLYQAHVRPIYRYLYSRAGNPADAEDLTSQVFMEAIESLERYRHRGTFRAWLFSIARHRLLNFQARRRPEVSLEQASEQGREQAEPAADPLAALVQDEEFRRLVSLVGSLRPDEQDLLRLRFVAELSFG